jgi:hypothetical protein
MASGAIMITKPFIPVLLILVGLCGGERQIPEPSAEVTSEPNAALVTPDQNCPDGWLHYEPATVRLSGRLVIETRYGPPNYGEEPETDEKLRVPFLSLESPISVCADPASDVNNENVVDAEIIQLTSSHDLAELAERRVLVSGRLSRPVTGYHFAEVVMKVDSIAVAR